MQTKTIGMRATTIRTVGTETRVQYHATDVVRFTGLLITLKSGGYRTATTKNRMNQTSNQFGLGFQVFQKAHKWFVTFKGMEYEFIDGMRLHRLNTSGSAVSYDVKPPGVAV